MFRRSSSPTGSVAVSDPAPPAAGEPRPPVAAAPGSATGFVIDRHAMAVIEQLPLNVMVADPGFVIRYVNPQSLATLRSIRGLLAVAPDAVVGSSIDVFHRAPAHQHRLLQALRGGRHRARFPLGEEWVELEASTLTAGGDTAGYLVTWDVVTRRFHAAERVVHHTSTVAAAIEQMRATITEVARTASTTASVTADAAGHAAHAGDALRSLSDASRQIGDVVGLISRVAAQTNLLALNATIEAARAGEHGRGFAVVAGEVKALAEETSQATADIDRRVAELRAGTDEVARRVAEVLAVVDAARDAATGIAATVEEQSAAVDEIARGASQAALEVRDFTS